MLEFFWGECFSHRLNISGRLCFQDIQAHSSTLNSTKSWLHLRPQECRVTAEFAFDLMTEELLAKLSSEHRSLSTPGDNVFSSCTCCEGLNCSLHQVFDTHANLVRFQHSTEQRSSNDALGSILNAASCSKCEWVLGASSPVLKLR